MNKLTYLDMIINQIPTIIFQVKIEFQICNDLKLLEIIRIEFENGKKVYSRKT